MAMSRSGHVMALYGALSLLALFIAASRGDVNLFYMREVEDCVSVSLSVLLGSGIAFIVVLLSRLAVAGFAATNVMLLSVAVWSGAEAATRDLLHWVSALIALPAAAFAGVPFFRNALGALRAGRANMDVPISLAVLLAMGVSLSETIQSGAHAYFDAAVSLLFFLLIGRYLDHRTRRAARVAAAELCGLQAHSATVIENGARRIYVGFNVKGRDVQSTVKDIQTILDEKLKLPEGYYYNYGGEFENLQSATQRLLIVVPIALIIILLLLYATVKNLRESLFVFSAIPLAAIGGVWALWLRGMPFSISAGVGFIALFGVAVLNGIVLIGQMNQMQKQAAAVPEENGASLAAVIQKRIIDSCMIRLRPVLMTALVASMGFLPMALSHGDGAEVQRPLATVVIGGLITSTLLTLLVLPAIYKMFTKK